MKSERQKRFERIQAEYGKRTADLLPQIAVKPTIVKHVGGDAAIIYSYLTRAWEIATGATTQEKAAGLGLNVDGFLDLPYYKFDEYGYSKESLQKILYKLYSYGLLEEYQFLGSLLFFKM